MFDTMLMLHTCMVIVLMAAIFSDCVFFAQQIKHDVNIFAETNV